MKCVYQPQFQLPPSACCMSQKAIKSSGKKTHTKQDSAQTQCTHNRPTNVCPKQCVQIHMSLAARTPSFKTSRKLITNQLSLIHRNIHYGETEVV